MLKVIWHKTMNTFNLIPSCLNLTILKHVGDLIREILRNVWYPAFETNECNDLSIHSRIPATIEVVIIII